MKKGRVSDLHWFSWQKVAIALSIGSSEKVGRRKQGHWHWPQPRESLSSLSSRPCSGFATNGGCLLSAGWFLSLFLLLFLCYSPSALVTLADSGRHGQSRIILVIFAGENTRTRSYARSSVTSVMSLTGKPPYTVPSDSSGSRDDQCHGFFLRLASTPMLAPLFHLFSSDGTSRYSGTRVSAFCPLFDRSIDRSI